jgi:hypothetical protein
MDTQFPRLVTLPMVSNDTPIYFNQHPVSFLPDLVWLGFAQIY